MVRTLSDGERFTTLAVSETVANVIRVKQGKLSVDNYLRKVFGITQRTRGRGRPVGTTGIPRRTGGKKKRSRKKTASAK